MSQQSLTWCEALPHCWHVRRKFVPMVLLLATFIIAQTDATASVHSTADGAVNQISHVESENKIELKRNYPQTWRSAGLKSESLMLEHYNNHDISDRKRMLISCPEQCRCGQVTGITCYSTSKDTPMPAGLPDNTRALTLYGYKLVDNTFNEMTELEKLNIYDSIMPVIPELPKTLTHLDIINSNVKDIHQIQSLSYLQSLNLAYNNITEANFDNLVHLISLDLSHNPIEKLPNFPSSLAVLNLKRTILSLQPTTWDVYLPNLKKLILTGTNMRLPPYLNLPKLEILDLSFSHFKLLPYLSGLPNLKEINLSHSELYLALPNHFKGPGNLRTVDLSYTYLSNLPEKLFIHNPHLKEVHMHHTDINYIKDYTFSGLYDLEILTLNDNINMTHFDDISLRTLHSLKTLDMSNSQVQLLPYSLRNTSIESLNIGNNTLLCDCHAHWLPEYVKSIRNHTTLIGLNSIRCADGILRTQDELQAHINSLRCANPNITSVPELTLQRGIGKTALLECNSTGVPNPIIIWHSPDKKYYMYNHTDIQPWFSDKFKYILNHLTDENSKPPIDPRIRPLKSGHLLVQNLTREDVGLYRCTAVNSAGSVTVTTFLWLTTSDMVSFEIQTLLFGLACAMTFLLTTLIVQLIRYIMDR